MNDINDLEEFTQDFINLIVNEFKDVKNVNLKVSTYPDYDLGCRVSIITDQDNDDIARLSFSNGKLRVYLPISNELFTTIYNLDKQFERFWLALYDKYKISKSVFFKKHNIKRLR